MTEMLNYNNNYNTSDADSRYTNRNMCTYVQELEVFEESTWGKISKSQFSKQVSMLNKVLGERP